MLDASDRPPDVTDTANFTIKENTKKLLEALYMFFKNLNQDLLGLAHLRQLSFSPKVKLICAEAIVLHLLLNSLQS